MYKIEGEDLYLIGTSEHSLIGMYMDKVLQKGDLPQKETAFSPCFRKETGAHGLEEKGFIGHKAYGKNHEYYPLVKKEEFRKMFMKEVVSDYFGSSYKNVVSFFLDEKKISTNDLKKLIDIIEKGSKNG